VTELEGKHDQEAARPKRLAEAIFESLDEGVTVADCSVPDMPLIYVNKAFERLTGYPAEEVLGRNCRFLHSSDTDQSALHHVRSCLESGSSCNVVLRNFRKDGSLFYNELHLSPINDADGKVAYYIGIQRDVTERVHAEQALWKLNDDIINANRELNKANERLSELLYVAAHDIKSPLTSIMLSLELLQEKAGKMPLASERRYIGDLRQLAAHIRDIVIDVLEARRVETGGARFKRESIDVALMARTVLRFYREQAQAKQIAIRLIAPAGGLRALADRNSVLVVVDNLVSNAIKYSPAGRQVTVRLSVEKGAVRLAVEDHGPGIDVEDLGKLFGRFVKLDAQPTGGEHSTGLGLYIVKNYVRMMKGKVWVESEKGKGSTFFVELPRVEARTTSLRAGKRSRHAKRIRPVSPVREKS